MLTRFDYDLTLASTSVLQEPTSAKGRSKKDGQEKEDGHANARHFDILGQN